MREHNPATQHAMGAPTAMPRRWISHTQLSWHVTLDPLHAESVCERSVRVCVRVCVCVCVSLRKQGAI